MLKRSIVLAALAGALVTFAGSAGAITGNYQKDFTHDAVGLLVFLVTAAVLARPAWIALRHDRWAPPALPRRTALWLTVGGVLWAVLRNLPWAPFTVLAP